MEPSFKADLDNYILECKKRLQKILQELDWTENSTLKDYNTNSIASNNHLKKSCSQLKSTFPATCVTENSLVLETPKLQSILGNNEVEAPENFQELQANFSREQKLKIYEHVTKNTKRLETNLLDKEIEGELSLSDILAQKKREEKRKKRRFRKSKPTHIEEVRCLVDLQMQALEQFMDNKTKKEETGLNRCIKHDDQRKEAKHRERNCPEKHDRQRKYREINAEYHDSHKKRRQRSSSTESFGARKIEVNGLEREKRRGRDKRRSKSRKKRKHRSRSKNGFEKKKHHRSDRRSSSRDKNISKDRINCKRRRYENEKDDLYQKYSSRSELGEHSREKYNEKYIRNRSRSPERNRKKHKRIKETTKNEHYVGKRQRTHQS